MGSGVAVSRARPFRQSLSSSLLIATLIAINVSIPLAAWSLEGPNLAAGGQEKPAENQTAGSESNTKTFVDLSDEELIKAVPELKHLRPAASQEMLKEILARAGLEVRTFFANFSNVTCMELISSEVRSPKLIEAVRRVSTYNYLALAQSATGKGGIQELRTDDRGEPAKPSSRGLIITSGFFASAVDFYPAYQADSHFRYLGREEMDKQDTYVVAYAQRPGAARETSTLHLAGLSEAYYMQGVAWIEPETFRILRLRTDIQKPKSDAGLLAETTEVLFSKVNFQRGRKTMWLPHDVNVNGQLAVEDTNTGHRTYYTFINQHHYSNYRLFEVKAEEKLKKP